MNVVIDGNFVRLIIEIFNLGFFRAPNMYDNLIFLHFLLLKKMEVDIPINSLFTNRTFFSIQRKLICEIGFMYL